MANPSKTVSDVIHAHFDVLTRAEKQLANSLLENYPVSCLGSITTVAENARVSTPTVARMVQKLGFKGYPEFQSKLHQEVEATISNPLTKRDRWASQAPGTHILNRFADAITLNLRQTLANIDTETFDSVAGLLSEQDRNVYFVGGRITGALAEYFFTHMQVIRAQVTMLSANSSSWPQYALNMKSGDILVVFDIRRYEQELVNLAAAANKRGAEVIVFTDEWATPAAKYARHTFRVQVEAPSAWDSSVVSLFLIEALIEAVQNATWGETSKRLKTLEDIFEQTRLFHKLS